MRYVLAAMTLIGAVAAPAWADGPNTGPDVERFSMAMSVPTLCRFGEVQGGNSEFDMGVITEDATGLLKRGLAPPVQRLQASFCNAPSELKVQATIMAPTGSTRPAPSGFARGVHYTAKVSGWTDNDAVFQTDVTGTQAAATQRQTKPREHNIEITLSDFHTAGGDNLRPIASSRYEGEVIVTLGPLP